MLKVRSATCRVVKFVPGVHIKMDSMGGTCGTHGGNLKERDHLQDLDVEGRKLIK
jgi:hypothetical protein